MVHTGVGPSLCNLCAAGFPLLWLATPPPVSDHTVHLPCPHRSNILAGPVYSNNQATVERAMDGCPADPAYVGLYGPVKPCTFVEVPGYDPHEEFVLAAPVSRGRILASKTYQVWALAALPLTCRLLLRTKALSLHLSTCSPLSRGPMHSTQMHAAAPTLSPLGIALMRCVVQDNVGNYARTDIWSVKWHNSPRSYITADVAAGNGLKQEEESVGAGSPAGN